jgi:anti-sigma factor RsiW
VRERWFGATGRKVPEIALEGDLDVEDALVLDAWEDSAHDAFEKGRPIVVRARNAEEVKEALAHPEVASVLVRDRALLELDLVKMTYGN